MGEFAILSAGATIFPVNGLINFLAMNGYFAGVLSS